MILFLLLILLIGIVEYHLKYNLNQEHIMSCHLKLILDIFVDVLANYYPMGNLLHQ